MPLRSKSSHQRLVGDKASHEGEAQDFSTLQAALVDTDSFWFQGSTSPLRLTRAFPETSPLLSRLLPQDRPIFSWSEWIHPADAGRVAEHFKSVKVHTHIDYRIVPNAENILWVRHHVSRTWKQGSETFSEGTVTNITQIKKLEQECLAISEREQNRIGQDLHDDLCQVLAGLSCLTRVLETRIAPKLPEEVQNLREINLQMVEAMDRTRALTHGLYPARMRTGDVRAALIELSRQVHTRFGVKVTTEFSGRFPEHSAQSVIQIYRIAQEAISNAIKHGSAKIIALTLRSTPSGMLLSIRDNGTGFSQINPKSDGIGTHIMRYRAGLLGGTIDLAPVKPHGVCLTFHYHPAKARI